MVVDLFVFLMVSLLFSWGLFVCLVSFWPSSSTTRLYLGQVSRLASDNFTCCHTRDRAGRPRLLSQHSDTDPTSKERAATAGIAPRSFSPGIARSTYWCTAPRQLRQFIFINVVCANTQFTLAKGLLNFRHNRSNLKRTNEQLYIWRVLHVLLRMTCVSLPATEDPPPVQW